MFTYWSITGLAGVKAARNDARAREKMDQEIANRRAALINAENGYLRVTRTGYDFGPKDDPDGIMVTMREDSRV